MSLLLVLLLQMLQMLCLLFLLGTACAALGRRSLQQVVKDVASKWCSTSRENKVAKYL